MGHTCGVTDTIPGAERRQHDDDDGGGGDDDAQDELREIQQIFRATPDGLPGNDDLGALSGWLVWTTGAFSTASFGCCGRARLGG